MVTDGEEAGVMLGAKEHSLQAVMVTTEVVMPTLIEVELPVMKVVVTGQVVIVVCTTILGDAVVTGFTLAVGIGELDECGRMILVVL